jgi:hypothetical protein
LVKMLEGPPIGHFSKTIKHAVCSRYRRCNTFGPRPLLSSQRAIDNNPLSRSCYFAFVPP